MTDRLHVAMDVRPGRTVLATVRDHRVIDVRRLEQGVGGDPAQVADAIAILRGRAPGAVAGVAAIWRHTERLGHADSTDFAAFVAEVGTQSRLPTTWLPAGAAVALGEWFRAPVDGPLAVLAQDVGLVGGVVIAGEACAPLQLDVGHLSVQSDGLKCACGARGCLHAYASETALQELARDVGSALEQPSAPDWQMIMSSHLAALQEETPLGTTVITARAGRALGLAAARLADAFGVVEVRVRTRHPDHWRVQAPAAQRALCDVAGPRAPRLVAAHSGEDAYFVGAVAAHRRVTV